MSLYEVALFGGAGAAGVELLRLLRFRTRRLTSLNGSFIYTLTAVMIVILGAIVALLVAGKGSSALTAVWIGATTPAVLAALMSVDRFVSDRAADEKGADDPGNIEGIQSTENITESVKAVDIFLRSARELPPTGSSNGPFKG